MTRIALIGDSHFDASSRFDDCVEIHRWIAEDIARRGVDLILHSGDVFERRSTPVERTAVAEWLTSMAAVAPVVIVRGNHDALGDLPLFARLRAANPITVEEGAAVHCVGGARIACLAWPRKAELMALTDAPRAAEETDQGLRGALAQVLGAFAAEFDGLDRHHGPAPRILLAHAMVRGSRVRIGQPPLTGVDLELGLGDLALAQADLVALGHIHCGEGNEWELGGGDLRRGVALYPGSPRRTTFGETEPKGYVIATIGGGGVGVERVKTPARPMLLLSGVMEDVGPGVRELVLTEESEDASYLDTVIRDAEIRFRYEVATEEREAAKADAQRWADGWRSMGVHSVKVEEVVLASTRARAPEVAAAKTPWDMAATWWRTQEAAPTEEQLPGLRSKLELVEGEVAA